MKHGRAGVQPPLREGAMAAQREDGGGAVRIVLDMVWKEAGFGLSLPLLLLKNCLLGKENPAAQG